MTHSSILEEEIPIEVKKQPWIRVQNNILARPERAILNWLCSHMPNAVTSDPLTAVGVAGAVIVLAGYIGSRFDPAFFLARDRRRQHVAGGAPPSPRGLPRGPEQDAI